MNNKYDERNKNNKKNEKEIIGSKETEVEIIYENKENKNKIKIFGDNFVKNNKNNFKLKIENKEEKLCEEINTKGKKKINIILKEIKTITDMSSMFSGCSSLLSISDISNWKTSNLTALNHMFYKCIIIIFA